LTSAIRGRHHAAEKEETSRADEEHPCSTVESCKRQWRGLPICDEKKICTLGNTPIAGRKGELEQKRRGKIEENSEGRDRSEEPKLCSEPADSMRRIEEGGGKKSRKMRERGVEPGRENKKDGPSRRNGRGMLTCKSGNKGEDFEGKVQSGNGGWSKEVTRRRGQVRQRKNMEKGFKKAINHQEAALTKNPSETE